MPAQAYYQRRTQAARRMAQALGVRVHAGWVDRDCAPPWWEFTGYQLDDGTVLGLNAREAWQTVGRMLLTGTSRESRQILR